MLGSQDACSQNHFIRTDSIFSFRSQKGYFPSLLNNLGRQAQSPFRANTDQWLMAYGAVYCTAAFIYVDSNIDDWARVQKEKHPWMAKTSPVITDFGGNPGIGSVLAFGVVSTVFSYKKGLQTSLLASQAMLTSGIWVRMIKILSGRERPYATYTGHNIPGGYWHGPFSQFTYEKFPGQYNSSFDSFISGHTATAFSIATVFAMQYRDIKIIPVISYTAAALAGISRLTEHQHWASEVFAGALVGYLCGRQVVDNFRRTHGYQPGIPVQSSRRKVRLSVFPAGNQVGVCLRW